MGIRQGEYMWQRWQGDRIGGREGNRGWSIEVRRIRVGGRLNVEKQVGKIDLG